MNKYLEILNFARTLDVFHCSEIRRFATARLSWAVPCKEALDVIADATSERIVEIGAGRGLWAGLLAGIGCEVDAYDIHGSSTSENSYTRAFRTRNLNYRIPNPVADRVARIVDGMPEIFHPIQYGGPERAEGADLLLLCWPPMSDMAYAALDRFTGGTVAYIGEEWGGCTGDEDFHRMLSRSWRRVRTVGIPQWPGIHDSLVIYTRVT